MKKIALGALALLALSTQTANAQSQLTNPGPALPGVCVYHNERLLAQSSVGQSLNTGMQALVNQVREELTPFSTAIQTELQSLQQTGASLPADQLQQRQSALQQQVAQAQQLEQTREAELRYTRQQQLTAIATAVDPLIVAVYQERGCGILIDRESVYVMNPAMDITDTVIQRLNAALPSVSFGRSPLPQQPAQ